MESSRSVLIIAHGFPPWGGPGVQRISKLVKHLPRCGWRPVVVCADGDAGPVLDRSLLLDVPPEAVVVRVPAFSIWRTMRRLERWRLRALGVALNLALQLPDPAVHWALRARRPVLEAARAHRPAALLSSSGPGSAHLLALWARERLAIPWVADFRDLWSASRSLPYPPGYRALNRRLEARVLRSADRVTTVSTPLLEDLAARLGHGADKLVEIANGYDEDDVGPVPMPAPGSPFTLTHIGTVRRGAEPGPLVDAARSLVDSGRVPAGGLRLRLVGRNVRRYATRDALVEAWDYVPHDELERFRRETHAFVLLLDTSPGNRGSVGAKLYEYLASDRPFLAIVPRDGAAARLIERTRSGLVVDDSPHAIAGAIERLRAQPAHAWDPDRELIGQLTRARAAEAFARELDVLVRAR